MKTAVFAHRGYSAMFPENTMLAFREAVKAGAEGIELDVQLTKDEQLVVIHDETLDRTTNGRGKVRRYLFKEVSRFLAGAEEKVPGLEEVLRWSQQQEVTLNIELKHAPKDRQVAAKEILRLLHVLPQKNIPIISSFDHKVLPMLKKEGVGLKTAALTVGSLIDTVFYLKEHQVEGLHFHFSMLTLNEMESLRKCGIELRPYTVNQAEDMKRLMQVRCTAIITDDPALALKVRESVANS